MPLYIKETGKTDAPIIVFLHGGGVSGWMWDKQAVYFKDYHVIIPDLPSHGRSRGTHFTSIRAAAEEIISIVGEKEWGRDIYLVGFSLGAQIAVEILSIKPQLINKAIISSALVRPISIGKGLIDVTIKMSYGFMKSRSFQKLQAKELYIGEEYFDLYYNDVLQASKEDMTAYLNANMSYKLRNVFKEHNVRTLVLAGSKEKGIMKKSVQDIASANKFCEGYMIPNVGHGVSLANPQLFNRIVEAWIKEEELPSELVHISI